MSIQKRNNVRVAGDGPATVFFSHGFGCDQNMWRLMAPAYAKRYRTVLFDLVGSGNSDLQAYDPVRHGSLQGYADDVSEIVAEFGQGPAIFIGHSVSAMIGALADLRGGARVAAHVMVGPSPCYINDGDYFGGFERSDIESLLETLESNYLGWSSTMAPAIMGAPGQPQLAEELTNSFCRTDPEIAKQFARVTFLSDNRADLPRLTTPALILQCSDDLIAPRQVGEYLHRVLPRSTLVVIDNQGDRATRLLRDLLDFTQARLGAGLSIDARAGDLHALVGDAVGDLRLAFAGRGLEHVREGAGACDVDPDRLAQLLGNLVANAMVYGDPGGTVTVTSRIGSSSFSVSVHNRGEPIPPPMQERIFLPMARGHDDSADRSVGLGLYIVAEIARAHGGSVALTSTPELGTTFTAIFPRPTGG